MGKKSGSGSGMDNPDHISECLETIFWVKILKFFDADPGSGMEKIRIRDKHPGSATLVTSDKFQNADSCRTKKQRFDARIRFHLKLDLALASRNLMI
jgi:hypothetical protein